MINWKVAPIDKWIGQETQHRNEHPFRRSVDHGHWTGTESGVDWSATMALLEFELGKLDAEHVVLMMHVHPFDLRNDGWIRANAHASRSGSSITALEFISC